MAEKIKKNVKNDKKNLQVSKNIATFVPKFVTPYNYVAVFEHVDSTPDPALKHNEALSIREILVRSSRGQRLDVNTRFRSDGIPDNMYTEDELKKIGHESIHDAPPDDIQDVVDVYAYQDELNQRKQELEKRQKDRRERSEKTKADKQQGESKPAPAKKDEELATRTDEV